MKSIAFTFLFSLSLVANAESPRSAGAANDVLREGEIKLLRVELTDEKILAAKERFLKVFNLPFPIFELAHLDPGHFALVSAPLGVVSGDFPSELLFGQESISWNEIAVEKRSNLSTEEVLDTPEPDVLPQNPKIVQRIAEEDAEQKKILSVINPERYWTPPFIIPVRKPISSHFGLYRIYTKHMRRRTHWGVDFRTPVGTPVKSSSAGVVVLAKNLYFPGKTIIIDHGLGLYTGYSHLSKMNVKVGDKIKAGQLIGKSGISGKVTGPHLHWFAVNARVKFDPLKLLEVKFPEDPRK